MGERKGEKKERKEKRRAKKRAKNKRKKLTDLEVNLIKVFLEFGKLLEMLLNLLGLEFGHRAECLRSGQMACCGWVVN